MFTEVGGEGVGLAIVQGDQIKHLLQAMDLRLFAGKDTLIQIFGQCFQGVGLVQALVTVADTGHFYFQQLLFPSQSSALTMRSRVVFNVVAAWSRSMLNQVLALLA